MKEHYADLLDASSDGVSEQSSRTWSVERIGASELCTAARVLAEAFAEDPVLTWAMPKAATRLYDATAFFSFHLRRMRHEGREIFATPDRAAVAVLTKVRVAERKNGARSGEIPLQVRQRTSVADYIHWIEGFSPDVDHRYLEFIGILPTCRAKGHGSLLLGSLLHLSACEGLPVWCWSSNPRNLSYYHRLGFEAGPELRWDESTPAVTPLLRPPLPFQHPAPAPGKGA